MKGCVIADLIRVWLLTSEPWVQSQLELKVDDMTMGQIFLTLPLVFPS
jgi:hypothetical protein